MTLVKNTWHQDRELAFYVDEHQRLWKEGDYSPILPTGPIDIALLDPPWWYNNRNTGGERKKPTRFGGGCRKYYNPMTNDELRSFFKALKPRMAPRSAMHCWVVWPRADWAMHLLGVAGMEYKTKSFIWIKMKKDMSGPVYGPGGHKASCGERVFFATRGYRMIPRSFGGRTMTPSVIMEPRMAHSEKPSIHHLLDQIYPPKLFPNRVEFFARQHQKGWKVWGNQLNAM